MDSLAAANAVISINKANAIYIMSVAILSYTKRYVSKPSL